MVDLRPAMYVWIATICMYVWCMVNIVRGIKDKENEMLDMMCNYNNCEGTDLMLDITFKAPKKNDAQSCVDEISS